MATSQKEFRKSLIAKTIEEYEAVPPYERRSYGKILLENGEAALTQIGEYFKENSSKNWTEPIQKSWSFLLQKFWRNLRSNTPHPGLDFENLKNWAIAQISERFPDANAKI